MSGGVVIGRVFVLDEDDHARVPRRSVPASRVEEEVERLERARRASVEELQRVYKDAEREMGPEAAKIFLFHIGALGDKSLIEPMRAMIREERVSAEFAASEQFRRWVRVFESKADSTFQTKVNDIVDLSRRLVSHLIGQRIDALAAVKEPTIVAARDLTPSQAAGFDRSKILGFVTDLGGKTSHTAIVARALTLPAVVGLQEVTSLASEGSLMILDGDRGQVIVDPDEATVALYRGIAERNREDEADLAALADEPAVTEDGVKIELVGNIEFPEEIPAVLASGGEGIGLYRTEFLYLTSDEEPTEEVHYENYRRCLDLLAADGRRDRVLTIRTVDLGADKYTQRRREVPERNPFLGLRSIRYCLQHLPMFRTQLRAILRASAHGRVKVMFPLITTVQEFRQARFLLHEAMEDLDERGQAYDPKLPVGMMVEVPSAAMLAPVFAREADFFSIGTNDLTQYTLAVDRINERVAGLYQPANPAVLKLIRDTARAGRRAGIPVSLCGEVGSEPDFAALLIGLGVRNLSLTAGSIPRVKRVIRKLTVARCERIAKRAMGFESDSEVSAYIRDRVRKLVPEAFDGRAAET